MTFALLIARQRCGTGALGAILDRNPGLTYLGEIFHPGDYGRANNYFTFLRDRLVDDREAFMPIARPHMFAAFMTATRAAAPGRLPVIDVKYSSLHQLDGGWRDPIERPWLLHLAHERAIPIIHLKRSNLVETYVSGRLAEANQVWHARSSDEIKIHSLTVDVADLLTYLNSTTRSIALVEEWLAGHVSVVEIEYSDLFDRSGLLSDSVAKQVCSLLQIETLQERAPVFVKQTSGALGDMIENFTSVQEALAGTEFEWMADQPRS